MLIDIHIPQYSNLPENHPHYSSSHERIAAQEDRWLREHLTCQEYKLIIQELF